MFSRGYEFLLGKRGGGLRLKRLRGFEKVALAPGERRTITFRLPIQQLAFIGRNNRPVVEPGDFDVMIGGLTTRLVVQ